MADRSPARELAELTRLIASIHGGDAPASAEIERALELGAVRLVELETAMLAAGERREPLAGEAGRLAAAMTELQELAAVGGERPAWEQYGFVLPRRPPASDAGEAESRPPPRRRP